MALSALLGTAALGAYSLQMMTDAVEKGAMCLSGSPAGYYFSPAPAGSGDEKNWVIFFQGGGWCYDARDCYDRSKTAIGDSSSWANTSVGMAGILSTDCGDSPDFCNFNHVYIPYCDGTSWTGNADNPMLFNDTKIYFRGKRNLDAVLESLAKNFGVTGAENVLFSGASAGGLAAYLNAERVYKWFVANAPALSRFKVAPVSGFFLDHDSAYGVPVFQKQMANMHAMANATFGGALPEGCISKHLPTGEDWKCSFAQYVYDFIEPPVMILNSAFDSWQIRCIYVADLPAGFPNQQGDENGFCGVGALRECQMKPDDTPNCTTTEIEQLNQYSKDFVATVVETTSFYKPGNGAFIDPCHTHCEARDNRFFNNVTIAGTILSHAVGTWWNSTGEPASDHTYLPCLRSTDNSSETRLCNPTCGHDVTAVETMNAFYA